MEYLSTIIEWALYGAVRYVMFWIPLVTPFAVERDMPWQFLMYGTWFDWITHNDNNGGPGERWLNTWFKMVIGELIRLGQLTAQSLVDSAKSFLLSVIGGIRTGYPSMGSWVDWLQRAIGYYVPSWAPSVVGGLEFLRNKLPSGIKLGWQSWYDLWESIKSSVRSWAIARYDQAKARAFSAFDWIVNLGNALNAWKNRVYGWIEHFKNNPYAYISAILGATWSWLWGFAQRPFAVVIGWLGPDWPKLLTFARLCLDFYFSLWSKGWRKLSEIVDNPGGFIADWLENELIKRW